MVSESGGMSSGPQRGLAYKAVGGIERFLVGRVSARVALKSWRMRKPKVGDGVLSL